MTLTEVVLVAVLLLAVFALAVPAFGGARTGDENEARAAISAALDAQVAHRDRTGSYSNTPADLDKLTPRMSHTVTNSTGPRSLSVAVTTATINGRTVDRVGVAVLSQSGSCWMAQMTAAAPGTLYAVADNTTTCSGAAALLVSPDPAQPGRGGSPTEPLEL